MDFGNRSAASAKHVGLALCLALFCTAPGGPAWAASDGEGTWVPGQVVVMLAASEAEALKRRLPEDTAAPAFLATLGGLGIEPALPHRPGRRNGLARHLGLDRVFRVRTGEGADPREISNRLESDPRVAYAHPDYLGRGGGEGPPSADDPSFAQQWHLLNQGQTGGADDADMDVVEAWRTTVGRPETLIAVLDTGIDGDHPEFRGRVARGGFDFVNEDDDPEADHSHGTRVSGIIGANTNNRFSVAGVHWDASIVPVKILNASNLGSTTDLAQGLLYAADAGADIANLSLIRYPNTSTLRLAVQYAHAAGVIQIGCNGNDGSTTLNYPASYAEVLATGWSNHSDERDPGSNFTSSLDVVAPGRSIRTVIHNSGTNGSSPFSGCSAATPNAVGVAGLLRALDPTLTQEQVADILRSTSDDEVGDPGEDVAGRDDYHGWGRVNAQRALAALGLVSSRRIHVHDIALHRVSSDRLEVLVVVLDELRGVEAGVEVRGVLTPPGGDPQPMVGTTGSNGVAVLPYSPLSPLPSGTFSFAVESLSLQGHVYEWSANVETVETHDPAFDGLHVGAMWADDTFDTLTIDVQVVDDDGLPEDLVVVSGRLTPPAGPDVEMQEATLGARGAIARFVFTPPASRAFESGDYHFQVTTLEKPGFSHESDHDVDQGRITHAIDDGLGDGDQDGVLDNADNCRGLANADQSDGDLDGVGDLCDVCPALFDPAQRDTDGDGTGNRCDCAPWDADATVPGAVLTLVVDPGRLHWNGVASADRYDVTRGALAALGSDDLGTCIADDVEGLGVDNDEVPPSGQGYVYLVRADDAICGPGPLGPDGDGVPRTNLGRGACQ